jgi:uncharacterized membrane protein YoaT (DUF817 family)
MSGLSSETTNAAEHWPPLRPYIDAERRIGDRLAARPMAAYAYEFVRFGIKQAWACLFGGIVVFLLIAAFYLYPKGAWLSRYDFLFLSMLAVQAALLATRLESVDEAKVIVIYHVVGTLMEVFKTSVGSWIYPEPSFFRIAGVPLFTGFMYSCIGSYLCRAWRLFDFRFAHHPPRWTMVLLSLGIYANFFSHHYMFDYRLGLFAAAILLLGRTTVYFRVWRVDRAMPLLVGLTLVAAFIWIAENVGTFTRTWLYPSQIAGWSPVSLGKLGAWFLLLIISYTLVTLVYRPRNIDRRATSKPGRLRGTPDLV